MQLVSNYNKRICFLLRVIDISNKYVWAIPLNDKKGTTILQLLIHFKNVLDESKCKANKIWVDKDSKFYNQSMKWNSYKITI